MKLDISENPAAFLAACVGLVILALLVFFAIARLEKKRERFTRLKRWKTSAPSRGKQAMGVEIDGVRQEMTRFVYELSGQGLYLKKVDSFLTEESAVFIPEKHIAKVSEDVLKITVTTTGGVTIEILR